MPVLANLPLAQSPGLSNLQTFQPANYFHRETGLMFSKALCLFPLVKAEGFVKKLYHSLPYLIILIIILLTLMLQNKKVGFEPGHHGWISSHTLAIISKAGSDNWFVGYTISSKDKEGHKQYYYFDRYPVFFSAFMNLFLSLSHNLATKVYIARQIMNFIFLSTLIMAFMLVDKLTHDKYLALAVALISFSNYFLLYYKDMVHFDQPALFGFVFLLYSIAVYKLDGKRKLLYLAAFVSIALGRGFASYTIMILWVIMEWLVIIKSPTESVGKILARMLKHNSFAILVIGIIWGAALLTYNVYVEAQTREVSYIETSIIESALRRTSLDENFNKEYEERLNWKNFTLDQLDRIINLSIPQGHQQLTSFKYLILPPMVIVIPMLIKREKPDQRLILLLMLLSGFFWLFLMRNLAAFHDFTAMYYIGIPLVFYMALLSTIKFSKQYKLFLLLLCLIVYTASNFLVYIKHSETAEQVNDYTYDFDRIKQELAGPGKNIYIQDGYRNLAPGVPYVTGFYLTGHYLTPLGTADYVISANKNYQSDLLTPFNKKIFLFKR